MRLEVGYKEVPPGIYYAEIAAIDLKKTDFGDRLVWRFKIAEGEHEGEEAVRFTSTKGSPKSACGAFLKALGYSAGELETDDLKGERVKIVVVQHGDKTRVETIHVDHDLAS